MIGLRSLNGTWGADCRRASAAQRALASDAALAEARALDAERKASIIRDPLHGIPVGIKEVIDVRRTTDM
ncbi:MAG: amidase family protein [bacterium]